MATSCTTPPTAHGDGAATSSIPHLTTDPPFLRDVVTGLAQPQRSIPCVYFYDERGSHLFEQITELEAYYPTRTELGIMEAHGAAMADAIGPDAVLIEYGSGSSRKTRLLLDARPDLAAYVPIDISGDFLETVAADLRTAYPDLTICPLAADFTQPLALPDLPPHARRVVYFPGSTIGNFEPMEAQALLAQTARLVGPGGGLLLGIDLVKDPAVLERAYDDPEGVTAAFNLNLLARINRDLSGDFDLAGFEHRAVYNAERARIEMYLVSTRRQTVDVAGYTFAFEPGDTIHTENSHKYTLETMTALAEPAGLQRVAAWMDANRWFAVLYFEAPPAAPSTTTHGTYPGSRH